MNERAQKSQAKIRHLQLSAFLVTNPINIYYLTGFIGLAPEERESLVIITKDRLFLILPKMYEGQGKRIKGVTLLIPQEGTKLFEEVVKILTHYKKVGFEAENIVFKEYQFLKKGLPKLVPCSNFFAKFRVIKDLQEIKNIQKAAHITDMAFNKILPFLKIGVSEKQIARKLLEIMDDLGSDGPSFDPIVAFGKNSALPHHFTGESKLHKNSVVLMDLGAKFKSYCSDLTRTIYFGKAPKIFKERYELVKKANEEAINGAKAGVKIAALHQLACEVLGDEVGCFLHSTGHGVGLNIHEQPRIYHAVNDKLKEGMVITVEPGLYYENNFGIRVEDLGVVTKNGFKLLSHSPRDLIEL